MRLTHAWIGRSERVKRLVMTAFAVGAFVLVARTLHPSGSEAATAPVPSTPVEPRHLGELHGQEFRLHVHASADGPRYTVISPDGVVLAEDLSEADVSRQFPGLQIETMTADAPCDFGPHSPDW